MKVRVYLFPALLLLRTPLKGPGEGQVRGIIPRPLPTEEFAVIRLTHALVGYHARVDET